MIRQCVICGAEFDTPPSSNKRTCSPACSAAWRSQQHKGRHNKWSASAKRNARCGSGKNRESGPRHEGRTCITGGPERAAEQKR